MSPNRLTQTDDLTHAAWIAPRLGAFGTGVQGIIPAGFEAYARILHPARLPGDEYVRWSEVAAASGAVAHALMQFHSLVGVSAYETSVKSARWEGSVPTAGDLEPDSLAALLDVLAAGHTSDPDRCWFCVWDGWGWVTGAVWTVTAWRDDDAPATDAVPETRPAPEPAARATDYVSVPRIQYDARVELPGRKYFLAEGPLDAALDVGYWPTPEWFLPQSPSIFWPDDLSWCVASEIDLFCTYVGGTRALIDELLADERLEVWEAHLDDPVAYDTDELNVEKPL
jgi:hypothetical protein